MIKEPRDSDPILDDIASITGSNDKLDDLLGELYARGYYNGMKKASEKAERDRIVSEGAAFEDRHIHPESRDA
jgi:hypothetical protein